MNIEGVIWLRSVVDKLAFKHHVETSEVEEVLSGKTRFRFVEKGEREGENVYMALGQTEAGRYLTVLFIHKKTKEALILSAREMRLKRGRCMAESNQENLPSFASLDEMVDFFEAHDMGDYFEQMPEAHFDVNIERRRHLVAIDEEIVDKLTEIAKQERVPAEALVNSWLKEKISGYSEKA